MGCLNAIVTQVDAPTIAVAVQRVGGISVNVEDAASHLTLCVTDVASHLTIDTEAKNVPVKVNLWLVCQVSKTETYEFLMVNEGELISIVDGYIKVRRYELQT
jgi:hypothetical protein